jgi:mono/diheme cytochrome c family protein
MFFPFHHRSLRSLTLAAFTLCAACAADDAGTGGDETLGDTGDGDGDGDATGDGDGDTGTEMTGQELFASNCAVCHGPEGEGSTIAYEIRHPHRGFSTWIVRNGRTSIEFANQAMPQFTADVLADDELELIFDYLDSFPQPDTPEGLYLDYCRNCHGVDASGGVVNAELYFSPIQDFIENVRQGRGGTNYGSRPTFMPARTSAELSDAEIQMIFDYVGTL